MAYIIKPWEDLTIQDDYMFKLIMSRKRICKKMLNNSDVESHPICWREPARNSLGKFESARQSHPCGVDNPALTSLVQ